jgi:hypothetical protein
MSSGLYAYRNYDGHDYYLSDLDPLLFIGILCMKKQRKMTLTKERVEQAYQKLVDFKKFNNFLSSSSRSRTTKA